MKELEKIAESIPKTIKTFIREAKISANVAQINVIQRLFLGICSADSFKFRKGDIVLVLEIAQFVRSKFACDEKYPKDGFSFFKTGDAMKLTPNMKTLVGVLFCDSTCTIDDQEIDPKENGSAPKKCVGSTSIGTKAGMHHDSSSRTDFSVENSEAIYLLRGHFSARVVWSESRASCVKFSVRALSKKNL